MIENFLSDTRPDQHKLDDERALHDFTANGLIKAWSFSTLKDFETCPYRVYLQKVKKCKRPSSKAAERGTEIHDAAEHFIKHESDDLHPALDKHMGQEVRELRDRYGRDPARFALEENWGFTDRWEETGFFDDDVWARIKVDLLEREDESSAQIIDWKSGRKFGNEMKHGDQGMQYAIAAFMKYPQLQFIRTRFMYLDQPPGESGRDNQLVKEVPRHIGMSMLPQLERRAFAMTKANETTLTTPKPSKGNCRFCPFAETGDCRFAIRL